MKKPAPKTAAKKPLKAKSPKAKKPLAKGKVASKIVIKKPAIKPTAKQTERKVREERRKTLKRRAADFLPDFRDLVENSVQGVLVHRNFRPLYANQAFAELFGYKDARAIMDMPIIRPLIPDDMWAAAEQDYNNLIRTGEGKAITRARGLHKDGHEIWLSVTRRVVDWHGTPALHLSAFDISERMVVEQDLLKSEQHLRSVLEILPYPIYIAQRSDGQILFVNRKTCLLFQKSAGQLLRSKSSEFYLNEKDRDELRQLLETISDIRDIEVAMKTSTGHEFVAEMAAISMDFQKVPAVLVALNDISQRKELEAELFQQASTDSLTGINNRRYFITQAEQELRRSRRFARDMSVMLIDLDHFKAVNDQHGHAVGDAVLQGAVKRALESLRQSDFIGRIGGEEFAVVLPETDITAARDVAERLRLHLAERPIIAERVAVPSTVSIGLAQLTAQDASIDAVLHRADVALYRAKNAGRNRVELANPTEEAAE